ncbi:hypothetical protein [Frigoribacterium salinisoli]
MPFYELSLQGGVLIWKSGARLVPVRSSVTATVTWWDHDVVEGESIVVDPVTQVELVVSPAISVERVLERERRRRDRELRSIRFFVDWGHAYPLWEDGTGK